MEIHNMTHSSTFMGSLMRLVSKNNTEDIAFVLIGSFELHVSSIVINKTWLVVFFLQQVSIKHPIKVDDASYCGFP